MEQLGPDHARHGFYYYVHTLGRAMNEYDNPTFKVIDGSIVDWRVQLIDALEKNQQPDGSWVGESKWMESNPVLVTTYVMLSLQEARLDLKQNPLK